MTCDTPVRDRHRRRRRSASQRPSGGRWWL